MLLHFMENNYINNRFIIFVTKYKNNNNNILLKN